MESKLDTKRMLVSEVVAQFKVPLAPIREQQSNREVRCITAKEVRVVTEEGKAPRIEGYAAVFNSLSEDLGFREMVMPGAFKNSLAKNPDVRLLLNHDDLPLARTRSGTLQLFEDDHGLRFVVPELDTSDPDVQRVLPKMKRGDLSEMSFAFYTVRDAWRMESGQEIRELHEVDINDGDVSLVTYPAYKATEAALRSRDAWKNETREETAPVNPTPEPTPAPAPQLSAEDIERELQLAHVLNIAA